jgi:sugar O-acyltransferase (sialic acid O-acetyltransferase NeuD family)
MLHDRRHPRPDGRLQVMSKGMPDQVEGREIVIVGDSAIAEVAYEYFTADSPHDVAAFTVTADYLRQPTLLGLPVAAFEDVADEYPPDRYAMFVAIGYGRMNEIRRDFAARGKELGYDLVSYVSSHAFVWPNVEIGENAFIFENNVVQPFVTIGDNVTLWSGNHIGHHASIRDNVFISSHVVISGSVVIGEHCFMGVNSTVANNVTVERYCLVGAGAVVLHDTEAGGIYGTRDTPARGVTTWERFGLQR